MRYRFPFLGIMNTQREKYWKEFQSEEGKENSEDILLLAKECICCKEREIWYVAMQVIKENKKRLKKEDLGFIKEMIVKSDWWDLVDSIASNATGALCLNYPELRLEVNSRIESENFWLRRSAIIYQLGYRLKTDETVLYYHILHTCREKEFLYENL